MHRRTRRVQMVAAGVALVVAACGSGHHGVPAAAGEADPPEVQLGERLFRETRFAQFFFAHADGGVNARLAAGDPVLDRTGTSGAPLPGPFRGHSMNCRACHLVDELQAQAHGGVRTYGDFARRSPVPARDDGQTVTARNSPLLVGSTLPRDVPLMLHFDAEFPSGDDLVKGTLSGRNFGWLPAEHSVAVAHIARVIRDDDGTGELAGEFAGALPYRVAFSGTEPSIPTDVRIPAPYRIDVTQASDAQVLDAVARLITAYMDSLRFSTDDEGDNSGSPYDLFLRMNGLPHRPADGESAADYSARLRGLVEALANPVSVTPADGQFQLHRQTFQFGAPELAGLTIFLSVPGAVIDRGQAVGNCVSCHPAPDFTDFRFHNTGASEREYDALHGDGAFAHLAVPGLAERDAAFDAYLPPSAAHPFAAGVFRSAPAGDRPGSTDLGVWNVIGNPDMPDPQSALAQILCAQVRPEPDRCTAAALLPLTIGLFKTPTVRDLGQSQPYLHTGQMDTIEDTIAFYGTVSALARQGRIRNAAPELGEIAIGENDVAPLAAFLRSLNEDYN